MPVSVVCDAAAAASVVSAALRESIVGIGNSSNQINNCSAAAAAAGGHKTTTKNDDNSDDDDNGQNVQNKLIASTKRVLLTKIEYEEVNNYNQSVLDTLKSKYIILKPSSSSLSSSSSTSPSSSHKNNNNNSTSGNNNSTGKINHLNRGNGGETEEDNNDKGKNQNTASSQNTNSEQKQQQQLNGIKNDPNQLPQPKHVLYPRENVQIGWKNSSRKWQIGAGMTNVGNTCYLNSTLQALFHVPAMANWLMSDSQHREKCEDECIICAMSKTLIASQSSQSPIRPYLIYTKLKLICKHLIMGRQEDAHEFLRYLVEAMEKSYLLRFRNWKELDQFSKETTPLNQILGGYLRSAVRCLACGHVSTTFQHFQDLLLDIRKANTIEEALDGYFSRERLEDMGYKCEACKKKVSATKQFSLERAPISLCIQLKRFSISGSKLLKPVTIRSRLDLRPYASKKSSTEHLTYRLVSMVTHLGISQHCGHYTAIGVTESGGYYQFDDSCVRSVSLHNVMNTNTYIIFYELEDPQQHLTSSTSGGKSTSTQVSGEHNHQNSNNNNNNDNNLVPVENFYSRKMNSNNNNDKSLVPIDNFLNRKFNGLFNNNNNENNIYQKQNNSQSSSSSSANNSETTKITNKSSDTKDKFSTITTTPMIGPQLPSDKSLLNGYKNSTLANSSGTQNSQNQNSGLISTTATNLPYYKLVNSTSKLVKLSSNGPSTNNDDQISSKSKQSNQQQTMNNSKLAIHFKNTNSGNSYNNNAKSQHETNSPSKSQLSDTNKTQTESTSKKSENVQAAKSVLPNMPKLESPTQRKTNSLLTSSPIVAKNSTNKSDVNNSRNSSTPDSSAASTRNDKARISIKSIPIKSLVPYETDDDESSKDEFDKEINKKKTVRNNGSSNSNRNVKCNYDSLDDLSLSSSEPEQNSTELLKSKTPPSPPVVKSKTGLWQVTSLNDTSSHTTIKNSTASSSSATPERKNPFATFPGISSSNFYSSSSSKLNGNGNGKDKKSNGSNNKKYEGGYNTDNHNGSNGSAVNQLLKLSHRGYGAPVLSWNGHKTEMEKEITEETRLERKRELKDDEDTEMDRGKQKKMKMNNNKQSYNSRESSNPGYNPFQEYQGSQSQQQQHQRRWNNNNNNNSNNNRSSSISNNNKNNNSNSNSSNNSNGRYRNHNDGGILYNNNNNNNRQNNNPFYRNNNNNNHHHNNFRNRNHHHRFNNHHNHHHHNHQRSRNQRNGGGENRFHHRRDS